MTDLTDEEIRSALTLKRLMPFRDWHVVKPEHGVAMYFDTRRKALAAAKKHAPAGVWATANADLREDR